MNDATLVIGNKNYSSWSLRPWLALKQAGAVFQELRIPLDRPDTAERLRAYSPTGRVPVYIEGDLVIPESLAICEYAAERFPAAQLWPGEVAERARARAVSMEMHSGFASLRAALPMDIRAYKCAGELEEPARRDVQRILAIWHECRRRSGERGDFLFGPFTIADAMFAPVVTRFVTYAVPLEPLCATYSEAVLALPAMQDWLADARQEREWLDHP